MIKDLVLKFGLATSCAMVGQSIGATGSVEAIGLSAAAGAVFTTLGGILGNTINQSIDNIQLARSSELNHDLEKAIIRAYLLTFNDLKVDLINAYNLIENDKEKIWRIVFGKDNLKNISKEDLEVNFLDRLCSAITDNSQLHKLLEKNLPIRPGDLFYQLMQLVTPDYCNIMINETTLSKYLSPRFQKLFTHHFRQQLKNNDKAKTVYFLMLLESSLTINEKILSKVNSNGNDLKKFLSETRVLHSEFAHTFLKFTRISEDILREIKSAAEELREYVTQRAEPKLLAYAQTMSEEKANQYNYKTLFTSMVERSAELEKLVSFMDGPRKFQWWVVVGPGGIGKSRLAFELSRMYSIQGFNAGFYDFESEHEWDHWKANYPTLIMLDYAFSNSQKVAALITKLEKKSFDFKCKVRVLLIDRSIRDDWSDTFIKRPEIINSYYGYNQSFRFLKLLPISDEGLWQIIIECINKSNPNVNLSDIELLENKVEILNSLKHLDNKQRPLFALLAGVTLGETGILGRWNSNQLLEYHISRLEDKIWNTDPFYIEHKQSFQILVILNTLVGKMSVTEITSALEHFSLLPFVNESEKFDETYSIIVDSKSDNDLVDSYNGITPDILGEFYVLKYIKKFKDKGKFKRDYDLTRQILEYAITYFPNTINSLTRIYDDFEVDLMHNMKLDSMIPESEEIRLRIAQYYFGIGLHKYRAKGEKVSIQNEDELWDFFSKIRSRTYLIDGNMYVNREYFEDLIADLEYAAKLDENLKIKVMFIKANVYGIMNIEDDLANLLVDTKMDNELITLFNMICSSASRFGIMKLEEILKIIVDEDAALVYKQFISIRRSELNLQVHIGNFEMRANFDLYLKRLTKNLKLIDSNQSDTREKKSREQIIYRFHLGDLYRANNFFKEARNEYTLIKQLLSGCSIDGGRFSKLSYPSFDDLNHIQNYIDELKEK